jgi:hypothetical protein
LRNITEQHAEENIWIWEKETEQESHKYRVPYAFLFTKQQDHKGKKKTEHVTHKRDIKMHTEPQKT